jgi:rod shape-determining protein MreC
MLGRKNKKIAVILLIFFVLLAVFNLTGWSKNVKDFFFYLSSPVQKTLWQGGKNVSDFLAGIFNASALKKETEGLRLENQQLVSQIAVLSGLAKENEVLRQALDLDLAKESGLILARTVSKDISQDAILINKGERDGLVQGMAVITGQKVLLGRVGSVYDKFAQVILISDQDSSFGAKILGKDIDVLAKGKGNGGLSLDLIPKDKEVLEDDLVVSSVLGGVYPQDLIVGQVIRVKKTDVDTFQSAEIKLAFEIKNLDYLFVLTP